jgi:L,D-transpeptidase ErfK/SrfK
VTRYAALALLALASASASAASFPLPADGGTVVGEVRVVRLENAHNTLLDVARHYDLGYDEIVAANPGVSVWLPAAGARIVVPTEFILPPKPWAGVVIDVPRRRLYYFPRPAPGEARRVVTFPIGIARPGWPTPLGETRIVAKFKDPSWIVPKDILDEHHQQGEPDFPTYFPPGPDNPMGMLAMQTGFPQIFIHATNRPWGVGMRVSHGCLHLYPEDAATLFPRLRVGTPVRIINQPLMVGTRDGRLYLSASPPVADYGSTGDFLTQAVRAVVQFEAAHGNVRDPVDWNRAVHLAQAQCFVAAPLAPRASRSELALASRSVAPYRFAPYGLDANDAEVPAQDRTSDPRNAGSPQ